MNLGNPAEQRAEQILRDLNYLTASRRHLEGPGDIQATPPATHRNRYIGGLLIEVKATREPPWRSTWGPRARGELLLACDIYDLEPMLAWFAFPRRKGQPWLPIWLPESDWPR